MLYEVAALSKLTEKEKEEGASAELILEPVCVIAESETSALLKVVQGGKLGERDLDRVEILVRPF